MITTQNLIAIGTEPFTWLDEIGLSRCTNSTHYNLSGWHGTNWIKYAEDTFMESRIPDN